MPNVEDLRFVRTEKAIRAAFMELVTEGPIESITVSAMCRRASISRNAFYLHHRGINELYAAMVEDMLSDVRKACVASAQKVASSRMVDDQFASAELSALEKHEDMLRALLPADDGSLSKRLAQGLEEAYVEAGRLFGEHAGSLEHRLRCSYVAWGVLGLLHRWINLTDSPLMGLLPHLEQIEEGIQANASHFLVGVETGC